MLFTMISPTSYIDVLNRSPDEDFLGVIKDLNKELWEEMLGMRSTFPSCFEKRIGVFSGKEMSIRTTSDLPIHAKPFRQNPKLRNVMRKQIKELLDDGIVRKSKSPWCSAAWLIPKWGHEEYRMVIDYRQLNDVTVADQYRPPRID